MYFLFCTLYVWVSYNCPQHMNDTKLNTNLSFYSTLCVCCRCVRDGRLRQGNLWRCRYSSWAHQQGMHHHHRWRRWDTVLSLFFTIPFFSSSHRLRSRCREGRPSRQDVPHLYRYAHVTSTILIQNIYCACSFNFLLIHKCHCVWADVLIQPLYSNIIHGSYNFHTLYFHCHLL